MEDSEVCEETLLNSSKFAYCRESSHPNYECYSNERQEDEAKIMDKTISSEANSSACIELSSEKTNENTCEKLQCTTIKCDCHINDDKSSRNMITSYLRSIKLKVNVPREPFSGYKKWKKRLGELWHSPLKGNVTEKETKKSEESDFIDVVSNIPSKSITNFSKPSGLKCSNQTEHIELLTAPEQFGEYTKPFKFEGCSKGLYSQKYLKSHKRDHAPICSNLNLASCNDDFILDLSTKKPNVQYLEASHSFESPIKMNPTRTEISVGDIIPKCKSFALYVELCQKSQLVHLINAFVLNRLHIWNILKGMSAIVGVIFLNAIVYFVYTANLWDKVYCW